MSVVARALARVEVIRRGVSAAPIHAAAAIVRRGRRLVILRLGVGAPQPVARPVVHVRHLIADE